MAEVPVNATDAVVIVDVTAAGQSVFAFDFRADDVKDLKAIYTSPAAIDTPYSGGVDFTASGLGNPNGGVITFTPPLAFQVGGKLAIYRDIVIARTTDYTQDLFADDINRETDAVFMILQEFARDIGRAIKSRLGGGIIPEGSSIISDGIGGAYGGPTIDEIENAQGYAQMAAAILAETAAIRDIVLSSVPNAFPSTRLNMASLPATVIGAFLTEVGRSGQFVRRSGNFSAEVAADTQQGVYVAPSSDPSGASGAFVREVQQPVPATAFGNFTGVALQEACNYMFRKGGGEVYLPSGSGNILSAEVTIPQKVSIRGGKGSSIQPGVAMSRMLKILTGLTKIEGVRIENVDGRASYGVEVIKPGDNLPVHILDLFGSGFLECVRWTDGDCLHLKDCTSISNGTFLHVMNDSRNSRVKDNYVLGGNGLNVDVKAGAGRQGSEGLEVEGNVILPSTGGAFCVRFASGLDILLAHNILDQVVSGQAVIVDGTSFNIAVVKIVNNWLGRQLGQSGADFGLYVAGNVAGLRSEGNTYTGWQQAGIKIAGGGDRRNFMSLEDYFYNGDRCLRDIDITNVSNALIRGASFAGTASIVENSGVTGRVVDCDFSDSAAPSNIGSGLRYGNQRSGMVLRNKGLVTIPSSGVAQVVNHGLTYTPSLADFDLMPGAPGTSDPGLYIITNITSTQFTIAPRAAPGSDVAIGWRVNVER